jgi:hypothetical protein
MVVASFGLPPHTTVRNPSTHFYSHTRKAMILNRFPRGMGWSALLQVR